MMFQEDLAQNVVTAKNGGILLVTAPNQISKLNDTSELPGSALC